MKIHEDVETKQPAGEQLNGLKKTQKIATNQKTTDQYLWVTVEVST